jgi:predicted TIM-barrel fold metal-dependent hydrolase
MNKTYFDAHCHIFTLRFGLKEARNMLHDMLIGSYPWHPPRAARELAKPEPSGVKGFLRQFYELISASFGSEEENLDFLQKESSKAMPGTEWHITPLMMDIFYILAYPLGKGEAVKRRRGVTAGRITETEFQEAWDEILDDLERHITSKARGVGLAKGNELTISLEAIKAERKVGGTVRFRTGLVSAEGFYKTEGYCFHLNNLVNLVKKHKGELYPFIAVDPRRPGIIDEIVGGKYVDNTGPFYGVKLYPRLGYHPQSAPMDALYRYGNDRKIPITFHCGKSGFPPGNKWKYAEFGNPLNFEPIIQRYPDLKINFAHLGSSDPTHEWADAIIDLMNNYDNVYSDLSCYTDRDDLKAARKLWDDNPILRSRLMFGSDFDVMYFTDRITMASYFANFEGIFSAGELKLLMNDNPMMFLGLH